MRQSKLLHESSDMIINLFEDLLKRNEINQIQQFTPYQSWVQRVLAISTATTSIVFCLIAIYLFLAIDPRRLVFRHQLIAFLLLYDLLKAVILLVYPARVLSNEREYYSKGLCQVVGFFTATSIEGADFAILAFAIHFFLLIFKPGLSLKVGKYEHIEGGLYRYRYYVYGLSVLIPLVMASLAYIRPQGYDSLVCWCYLPERPVWYRFVLSWVPRYVILISIIAVYCSIYFYVIKEFKTLSGFHSKIEEKNRKNILKFQAEQPSFWSSLKFSCSRMKDFFFPNFMELEVEKKDISGHSDSNQTINGIDNDSKTHTPVRSNTNDTENYINDPEIYEANLKSFKDKQKNIAKQMKTIFIYPIAYCFVWLFPFILHITQVNYEEKNHPIFWLNCMGAFMQPFNGFVDSLVFFYRERPWEYTVLRNFKNNNSQLLKQTLSKENTMVSNQETSNRNNEEVHIKEKYGFNLDDVPRWRKVLNDFHFPLFLLPSMKEIDKIQMKIIGKSLDATISGSGNALNGQLLNAGKSDFSHILFGDMRDSDFRRVSNAASSHDSSRRESLKNSSINVNPNTGKSDMFAHVFRSIDMNTSTIFEEQNPASISPHNSSSPDILAHNLDMARRKSSSHASFIQNSRSSFDTSASTKRNSSKKKSIGEESVLSFLDFLKDN